MARLAVRRCCLFVGLVLFVLGVTTTMRTAVRVNITAIFEEEDFEDFEAVFYRTLHEYNNASKDIHWFGQAVTARRDLKATISAVCNLMEGRRSSLHVLVVFGKVSTIQTVNLLSQALGIPVMGYMMDKGDGYIQSQLAENYVDARKANSGMSFHRSDSMERDRREQGRFQRGQRPQEQSEKTEERMYSDRPMYNGNSQLIRRKTERQGHVIYDTKQDISPGTAERNSR